MTKEGPQLDALLHRLTDCPAEFLEAGGKDATADTVAIVCDHMRRLTPDEPPELSPALAEIRGAPPALQTLLAILCWLLHDEWFLARPNLAPALWKLITSPGLARLSQLTKPTAFVLDADRREELVRFSLHALGLRPNGETVTQAADRLSSLDSSERDRVLRATAAAERRAREVREAMAQAKALESASRYGE